MGILQRVQCLGLHLFAGEEQMKWNGFTALKSTVNTTVAHKYKRSSLTLMG